MSGLARHGCRGERGVCTPFWPPPESVTTFHEEKHALIERVCMDQTEKSVKMLNLNETGEHENGMQAACARTWACPASLVALEQLYELWLDAAAGP